MHPRNRRFACVHDHSHCLIVKRVTFRVGGHIIDPCQPWCWARRSLQNLIDIARRAAFLEVADNRMNLAVRNVGAVYPYGHRRPRRQIKHIAMSQQVFRALLVENRPRVHSRGDLKRDSRRHVGLDEAGDHVHRGSLCGKDQVYAGCTCFLRQSYDQFFDLLAHNHHHVGEFVNDNDDKRQWRQDWMLNGFFLVKQVWRLERRILDRFAGSNCIANLAVVAANIAHAQRRHQRVTAIHLRNTPAQRIGRFPHVSHHRRKEMWNAFIH